MVSKGTRLGCRIPSLVSLASINALGECPGNPRPSVTHCTWAVEIYSSNVVGYTRLNLEPGFNLVGCQFVPVGTDSVDDILKVLNTSNLPGIDPDTQTSEGFARLQKWVSGESYYVNYEWIGEGIADYWDWDGIDNQWLTEACGDIATIDVNKGEGVWLWLDPSVVSAQVPVTIAGEVSNNSSVTVNLVSGFNLISNPFPVAINIQDLKGNNLPGIDPDTQTSEGFTRLQKWIPGESYYANFEWIGEGIADYWDWQGIDNKWLTEACGDIAEDVIIQSGEGFWIWIDPSVDSTGASITFENPAKAQ